MIIRFSHAVYIDGPQLERLIFQTLAVHEYTLIMRAALSGCFSLKDLQDLPLSDLCSPYVLGIREGRIE